MSNKRKIVVFADYLDFRDDIRLMLHEAARYCDLIIYTNKPYKIQCAGLLPSECTIKPLPKRSLFNKFIFRIYDYLASIPVPESFWLYKEFELQNSSRSKHSLRRQYLNKLKKLLPKIITYDKFLQLLVTRNYVDQADQYWFVTPIGSHEILSKALRENPDKTKVYVYSWDHIYKYTSFSKLPKYLCWNHSAKSELLNFHSIPEENIKVVGVSPFYYLRKKPNPKTENTSKSQFIVGFAFACGVHPADHEELEWFVSMSQLINILYPDIRISARLYPLQNSALDISRIYSLNNVEVHNPGTGSLRSYSDHQEKLAWFDKLSMFTSFGTTLGLEAALYRLPSFHIKCVADSSGQASLSAFSNARHLSEDFSNKKSWISVPSDSYLVDAIEMTKSDTIHIYRPDMQPILPSALASNFLEG